MSILVNQATRVVVQGITGQHGSFHTLGCKHYGTNIVAGVTPGKGGTWFENIPIFDTVKEAVQTTSANAAMNFVPPAFAADAIYEAAEAGVELIVAIPDGIPVMDMMRLKHYLANKTVRLIGPNCSGIITPGECKIGPFPEFIHKKGNIGVVVRSGTLTYEAIWQLTQAGLGQSTSIGIGSDPIHGTGFIDVFSLFEADTDTRAVVMVGEIGGSEEEELAAWIKEKMTKPVIAFIAGATAPAGRRMGHAGAMFFGDKGRAAGKVKALREAGVTIVEALTKIGETAREVFRKIGEEETVRIG